MPRRAAPTTCTSRSRARPIASVCSTPARCPTPSRRLARWRRSPRLGRRRLGGTRPVAVALGDLGRDVTEVEEAGRLGVGIGECDGSSADLVGTYSASQIVKDDLLNDGGVAVLGRRQLGARLRRQLVDRRLVETEIPQGGDGS